MRRPFLPVLDIIEVTRDSTVPCRDQGIPLNVNREVLETGLRDIFFEFILSGTLVLPRVLTRPPSSNLPPGMRESSFPLKAPTGCHRSVARPAGRRSGVWNLVHEQETAAQ